MTEERTQLYDQLAEQTKNTNLYEVTGIEIPNNNRIFIKEEYLNPTGSHYDRFWVEYLRHLETIGKIRPGMDEEILETTSGNSGASLAWACQQLGYKLRILIPENMPYARIAELKRFGAEVETTPKGKYIGGMIDAFREKLSQKRWSLPNHAMHGDEGPALEKSFGLLADEMIEEIGHVDYFVSACGNGLNTKGIGQTLKAKSGTKIIGMEPETSHPVYSEKYGETQTPENCVSDGSHNLIGVGPGQTGFPFPIIHSFIGSIDEIRLITKEQWELAKRVLENEGKEVGNTTAACFYIAHLLSNEVKNSTIVIVGYDQAWNYFDQMHYEEYIAKNKTPKR